MVFQTTLVLDSSTAAYGKPAPLNFTVIFDPPIELDPDKTHKLALISANIWYSWHNISAGNNKFRYSADGGGLGGLGDQQRRQCH